MRAFQNRTVGFWLGFAGGALALVGSIGYTVMDMGDRTFSWLVVALMLIGVVCEALVTLTELRFMPLLPAVFIGSGFAWFLYLGLPTLSDLWNGVNYVGGNTMVVFVFGGIFLLATVAAILSAFSEQRRQNNFVNGQ